MVATADFGPANRARLEARYDGSLQLERVSKRRLLAGLEMRFQTQVLDGAIGDLERHHPELSARRVVTLRQAMVLLTLPPFMALGFYLAPIDANVAPLVLLTLGSGPIKFLACGRPA